MKKLVLILFIVLCLVACGNTKTGYIEFNGEKSYENEELSLGFKLPEGYEFESEEALLEKNLKLISVLAASPVGASIHMAVTPDNNTSIYSVAVFQFNPHAEVSIDYLKKFGDKFALKVAESKGVTDVISEEKTVSFCNRETSCIETSYVVDGKTEYLLCYTGILNNHHICIFTWGTSSEETVMLMEQFYKVAN